MSSPCGDFSVSQTDTWRALCIPYTVHIILAQRLISVMCANFAKPPPPSTAVRRVYNPMNPTQVQGQHSGGAMTISYISIKVVNRFCCNAMCIAVPTHVCVN